jgi:hypothetical protein
VADFVAGMTAPDRAIVGRGIPALVEGILGDRGGKTISLNPGCSTLMVWWGQNHCRGSSGVPIFAELTLNLELARRPGHRDESVG